MTDQLDPTPDKERGLEPIMAEIGLAAFHTLPLIIMRPDGVLSSHSEAFEGLFLREGEVPCRTFTDFIRLRMHPNDQALASEHFARWLANPREVTGIIFQALRADGVYRTFEMRMMQLTSPAELGYMLLFQDVTERVFAEKTLQNLREIVDVIAHELRNMGNGLLLHIELLLKQGTGKWRERADTIKIITGRINRLLEDLLSFARLERGDFSIQPKEVSLNDLVNEVAETLRPIAEAKKIGKYEVSLSSNMPRAIVDQQRIAQVLANLILNAINYTPEGGTIRVITGKLRDGDDEYKIIVYDSGPGVPPGEQETIFERGQRGSNGQMSGISGSGLGLFIGRELMRQHGGDLIVESRTGNNSYSAFQLIFGPSVDGSPGFIFPTQ